MYLGCRLFDNVGAGVVNNGISSSVQEGAATKWVEKFCDIVQTRYLGDIILELLDLV